MTDALLSGVLLCLDSFFTDIHRFDSSFRFCLLRHHLLLFFFVFFFFFLPLSQNVILSEVFFCLTCNVKRKFYGILHGSLHGVLGEGGAAVGYPASYTQLTLPTKREVWLMVVCVS